MAHDDLTGLSEINALLGPGTEYEGKLVFRGRVRIDGRFEGEIKGDDILIVGETAELRAKVDVGTLIVLGGRVRGDVAAHQLVELHAPGEIHGDVQTPQLFIDKGAVFEGQCAMGPDPSEVHELDDREAMLSALGADSIPPPPRGTEAESSSSAEDAAHAETASVETIDEPLDRATDPSTGDAVPFVAAPLDDDEDDRA